MHKSYDPSRHRHRVRAHLELVAHIPPSVWQISFHRSTLPVAMHDQDDPPFAIVGRRTDASVSLSSASFVSRRESRIYIIHACKCKSASHGSDEICCSSEQARSPVWWWNRGMISNVHP